MSQSHRGDPRRDVAEHRAETAGNEPIDTTTRSLQDNNGTPECNLGANGRDIAGFEPGDEVTVVIYRDCAIIRPKDTGCDGED